MDLEELQIKVQNEYSLIRVSKTISDWNFRRDTDQLGCVPSLFLRFVNYGENLITYKQSKRNYDVYEREADELLQNAELKKYICTSLKTLARGEILSEENYINYVTAILYENKIRNKFVIPLEPALFAHIAYKISEQGINNFCAENSDT